MKEFRFSLGAVLDLREMRRDVAERELARAHARVDDAADVLDRLTSMREKLLGDYARLVEEGELDPFEAAMRSDYIASLGRRQDEARASLALAEYEREERRRGAVEAARDAQALERLSEREREHYMLEAARAEQSALDEMNTVSHARAMAERGR